MLQQQQWCACFSGFVFSRKAESAYRNGMQATKAAIAFELFNMPNLPAHKHDTQKCRQHHCRISMEGTGSRHHAAVDTKQKALVEYPMSEEVSP